MWVLYTVAGVGAVVAFLWFTFARLWMRAPEREKLAWEAANYEEAERIKAEAAAVPYPLPDDLLLLPDGAILEIKTAQDIEDADLAAARLGMVPRGGGRQ